MSSAARAGGRAHMDRLMAASAACAPTRHPHLSTCPEVLTLHTAVPAQTRYACVMSAATCMAMFHPAGVPAPAPRQAGRQGGCAAAGASLADGRVRVDGVHGELLRHLGRALRPLLRQHERHTAQCRRARGRHPRQPLLRRNIRQSPAPPECDMIRCNHSASCARIHNATFRTDGLRYGSPTRNSRQVRRLDPGGRPA